MGTVQKPHGAVADKTQGDDWRRYGSQSQNYDSSLIASMVSISFRASLLPPADRM
jgi:hypothetical protein